MRDKDFPILRRRALRFASLFGTAPCCDQLTISQDTHWFKLISQSVEERTKEQSNCEILFNFFTWSESILTTNGLQLKAVYTQRNISICWYLPGCEVLCSVLHLDAKASPPPFCSLQDKNTACGLSLQPKPDHQSWMETTAANNPSGSLTREQIEIQQSPESEKLGTERGWVY